VIRFAAMYFKVVGDISEVETIATGSGIRERRRLWKIYGKVDGGRKKALRTFALVMGRLSKQNFTGTKLMELGARNSKSSVSSIINERT
jgi:hypothetical protein